MPNTQPNIVLLVGEDVGRHLGCYGDPDANTPNLDQLAAQGCRFTQGFTHAPVCAPSRSGLVTGMYPFSFGTHHMRSVLKQPPRLFTHELRDAGYFVSWPTKTDFNFTPPEDFADSVQNWIGEPTQLPREPFFAYTNFHNTHESGMWRSEEEQAQLWVEHGQGQRCDPTSVRVPDYLPDTPEVRRELANYHDNLTMQDHMVAQAIATAKQASKNHPLIIIYMTDHGRGMVREKRWCYHAGIALPLIIQGCEHLPVGETFDELVAWVDIAPTILALAGAEIPGHYHGRVCIPGLPGAAKTPREFIIAGRDRMDECFDRVRVLRDKKFHYIRNDFPELPYAQRLRYMEQSQAAQELRRRYANDELTPAQSLFFARHKPPRELYNAVNDPQMLHNLAEQPEHQARVKAMDQALQNELDRVGDLGLVPERELIERGLVEDVLVKYHERLAPLPKEQQIGAELSILEMPR